MLSLALNSPLPRDRATSVVAVRFISFWLGFLGIIVLHLFFFLRAAPATNGSSQARGLIGAAAASLHHSHSNAGSEPHL